MTTSTETDTDPTFARDITNHWMMFGSGALVKKLGRGWITSFRGRGHPTVFKTKTAAMKMADAWVMALDYKPGRLVEA